MMMIRPRRVAAYLNLALQRTVQQRLRRCRPAR